MVSLHMAASLNIKKHSGDSYINANKSLIYPIHRVRLSTHTQVYIDPRLGRSKVAVWSMSTHEVSGLQVSDEGYR